MEQIEQKNTFKYIAIWSNGESGIEPVKKLLGFSNSNPSFEYKKMCLVAALGDYDQEIIRKGSTDIKQMAEKIKLIDSRQAFNSFDWCDNQLLSSTKGIIVQAQLDWDNESYNGIVLVRDILRLKHRITLPVVFVSNEKRNEIARKSPQLSIVNTFGLGHAFYCNDKIDYPFNFANKEHSNTQAIKQSNNQTIPQSSVFDFLDTRQPLNQLQMQDLMYFCDPSLAISRLKHDFTYNPEQSLEALLQAVEPVIGDNDPMLRIDIETLLSRIGNMETQEMKRSLYNEASNLFDRGQELLANNKTSEYPVNPFGEIFVLLLDDRYELLNSFICDAKDYDLTINAVQSVPEAMEELTVNRKYSVVICDLRLEDNNGLLLEQQGYDLIRLLHFLPNPYGVIVLSTLPRNFKLALGQYSLLEFNNFPFRESLHIPKYRNDLIDLIIETHRKTYNCRVEKAISNTDMRAAYLYWRQSKHYHLAKDIIDFKAEKAISSFLDGFDFETSNGKKNKSIIYHGLKNLTADMPAVKYRNSYEQAEMILHSLWEKLYNGPEFRESNRELRLSKEKDISLLVDCLPIYVEEIAREYGIFLDYDTISSFCLGAVNWLFDFNSFVLFYQSEYENVLEKIRWQLEFSPITRISFFLYLFATGVDFIYGIKPCSKETKIVSEWKEYCAGRFLTEFKNISTVERWKIVKDFIQLVDNMKLSPKVKRELPLYVTATEAYLNIEKVAKELGAYNSQAYAHFLDDIGDDKERCRQIDIAERMAEEKSERNFRIQDFEDRLVARRLGLFVCNTLSMSDAADNWDSCANNILQNGIWGISFSGTKRLQINYWVKWSESDSKLYNVCTEEERLFFERILEDKLIQDKIQNTILKINTLINE